MKYFDKAERGDTDNGFYQSNFDAICESLESGKAVWLYCWCTGHTMCQMVEGTYRCKLKEKYGDRLKEGIYDKFHWQCYYLG